MDPKTTTIPTSNKKNHTLRPTPTTTLAKNSKNETTHSLTSANKPPRSPASPDKFDDVPLFTPPAASDTSQGSSTFSADTILTENSRASSENVPLKRNRFNFWCCCFPNRKNTKTTSSMSDYQSPTAKLARSN